jgi:hypothetical protein
MAGAGTLVGKGLAELLSPLTERIVSHNHAEGHHQPFDVTVTEAEVKGELHAVTNELGESDGTGLQGPACPRDRVTPLPSLSANTMVILTILKEPYAAYIHSVIRAQRTVHAAHPVGAARRLRILRQRNAVTSSSHN